MKSAGLGQNFLVNKSVASKICDRFLPVDGDILEIGPGRGVLTELLQSRRRPDNRFYVVELDKDLYEDLRARFDGGVQLILADVLNLDLTTLSPGRPLNLVGNLPYYISAPIIDWVVAQYGGVRKGVFMLQKEFVDKLTLKKVTPQGLIFNYLFTVEKCFNVRPGSFSPAPKVTSTVFAFARKPAPALDAGGAGRFYDFLKACFKNRRKTLVNNLTSRHGAQEVQALVDDLGLSPRVRAEELGLEDFLNFYRALKA